MTTPSLPPPIQSESEQPNRVSRRRSLMQGVDVMLVPPHRRESIEEEDDHQFYSSLLNDEISPSIDEDSSSNHSDHHIPIRHRSLSRNRRHLQNPQRYRRSSMYVV